MNRHTDHVPRPGVRVARALAVCAALAVAFLLTSPIAAQAATPQVHEGHHPAAVSVLASADQHVTSVRVDQPYAAPTVVAWLLGARDAARTAETSQVTTSLTAQAARVRGPPGNAGT